MNKELRNSLRDKVEEEFGKQVKHLRDCRNLSGQIFERTNRQLSISTIKRFFGLIESPFNPSKYTLDTFSAFVGFGDWNSYMQFSANDTYAASMLKDIDKTVDAINKITDASLGALIERTSYNESEFVHRLYVHKFFNDFMNSDKVAALLTAPTGYGKTSAVLQFCKELHVRSDLSVTNNLICLLDGNIFFMLYNHPEYFEVLRPIVEFNYREVQDLFNNAGRKDRDGHFILIIDAVDLIFQNRDKYHQLVGNLMQLVMINKLNKWFKLILTCNPDNVSSFASYAVQNTALEESFYNFSFRYRNYSDVINLPLFNDKELKHGIIKKLGRDMYYKLCLQYPDLISMLKTPLYLNILTKFKNVSNDDFSEVGFYNHFIQEYIINQPFAEEKHLLISKLLQFCSAGEGQEAVDKETLLKDENLRVAYQEMVNDGILCETVVFTGEPEFSLTVRFVSSRIFEYLMTRWLMKNQKGVPALLDSVFVLHKNSIDMQHAILKWVVKVGFHEEKIDLVKQVHEHTERTISITNEIVGDIMPGNLRSIHEAFVVVLRSNNELSRRLLVWLAQYPLGHKLYFEEYFDMDNLMYFPEDSLDVYATSCKSVKGDFLSAYLRFLKGFYSEDFQKCSYEYETIRKIDFSEIEHGYFAGYYFSSYYLYAFIFNKPVSKDLISQIVKSSEQIKKRNIRVYRHIVPLEYYVVIHLNACDLYDEVLKLAKYILPLDEKEPAASAFYREFFRLCYARALLKTGSESAALKIYDEVRRVTFPIHLRHFMQLNVNLAVVDFLIHQHNTGHALQLVSETKTLAHEMGYTFFIRKAEILEAMILNQSNDAP